MLVMLVKMVLLLMVLIDDPCWVALAMLFKRQASLFANLGKLAT